MGRILLEICCGSADDVIEAARGGADRVELNSSLFLGGLTPTAGMLRVLRRQTDIPVMAMVRPRAGGFCYTDAEFETAKEDARILLENGADGLVFGFLHEDGTVDEERTRALKEIAEGRPCVFHRAIDVVPDWKRALGQLIGLGVTRVLTSGQQSSALLALDTIREMIRYADGAIEILPGGGIRLGNVDRVTAATRFGVLTQVIAPQRMGTSVPRNALPRAKSRRVVGFKELFDAEGMGILLVQFDCFA